MVTEVTTCPKCGGNLHGPTCKLCEMFETGQVPGGHHTTTWPQNMGDSLGVHPDQIPEAMERNKRHGVTGVTYNADGEPLVADRGARKKLLRVEGVHDKQGGYGD